MSVLEFTITRRDTFTRDRSSTGDGKNVYFNRKTFYYPGSLWHSDDFTNKVLNIFTNDLLWFITDRGRLVAIAAAATSTEELFSERRKEKNTEEKENQRTEKETAEVQGVDFEGQRTENLQRNIEQFRKILLERNCSPN